jgi:hypothetical protein
MNKTENRLLESAAKDKHGIVFIDRYRRNGAEHKAACYLHAENYGLYYAADSRPHFKLWPHVRRAMSEST